MLKFVFGVFIILHGLVHLLYFGQSQRYFELQDGMIWPDGAWAFSRLLGNETTRSLTSVLCIVAAILFVAGSLGMFANWSLWRAIVASGAVFSSAIYLLLWNGQMQRLANQGAIAILINLAILFVFFFTSLAQKLKPRKEKTCQLSKTSSRNLLYQFTSS